MYEELAALLRIITEILAQNFFHSRLVVIFLIQLCLSSSFV